MTPLKIIEKYLCCIQKYNSCLHIKLINFGVRLKFVGLKSLLTVHHELLYDGLLLLLCWTTNYHITSLCWPIPVGEVLCYRNLEIAIDILTENSAKKYSRLIWWLWNDIIISHLASIFMKKSCHYHQIKGFCVTINDWETPSTTFIKNPYVNNAMYDRYTGIWPRGPGAITQLY